MKVVLDESGHGMKVVLDEIFTFGMKVVLDELVFYRPPASCVIAALENAHSFGLMLSHECCDEARAS